MDLSLKGLPAAASNQLVCENQKTNNPGRTTNGFQWLVGKNYLPIGRLFRAAFLPAIWNSAGRRKTAGN
jgi:hypothetical protein